MSETGEPLVTALAVLRPARGREVTGEAIITAGRLPDFLPAPGAAREVRSAFEDAGFEVGPMMGISMTLMAPRSRFEEYFGTPVRTAGDDGLSAVIDGEQRKELPLEALPAALARLLLTVTFERAARVMTF